MSRLTRRDRLARLEASILRIATTMPPATVVAVAVGDRLPEDDRDRLLELVARATDPRTGRLDPDRLDPDDLAAVRRLLARASREGDSH